MPSPTDSAIGRAVQKVAGTRAFALVGSKVFPPIDRVVSKLTGGRVVLSAALVPSLVLTTTGRKSGQQRRTPLATLPIDDDFLVVGSNFGKEHHPAWTANLMANPKATVTFKGEVLNCSRLCVCSHTCLPTHLERTAAVSSGVAIQP